MVEGSVCCANQEIRSKIRPLKRRSVYAAELRCILAAWKRPRTSPDGQAERRGTKGRADGSQVRPGLPSGCERRKGKSPATPSRFQPRRNIEGKEAMTPTKLAVHIDRTVRFLLGPGLVQRPNRGRATSRRRSRKP